jgi:hypothetical protein
MGALISAGLSPGFKAEIQLKGPWFFEKKGLSLFVGYR